MEVCDGGLVGDRTVYNIMPAYTITWPSFKVNPPDVAVTFYSQLVDQALTTGSPIPNPRDSINPFLFGLGEPAAATRMRHEIRATYDTLSSPGNVAPPLETAGAAGVHERGMQRHEDDAVRWLGRRPGLLHLQQTFRAFFLAPD